MLWFKKKVKLKCDHFWHELNVRTVMEWNPFNIPKYTPVKYADCFCHLCEKHISVTYERWKLEEKAQIIKQKYKIKN